MRAAGLMLLAVGTVSTGCFGARSIERSYYMLEGVPLEGAAARGIMPGRVYVRDLEPERVYDKMKLVVRKSQYVLQYSGSHSWAVRPNRMLSDIVAESLTEAGAFSIVTRQLAEGRPDYTFSGTLRAIEVWTDRDPWSARLAIDLELVRFDDGRVLWRHTFDDSRPIPAGNLDAVPEAVSQVLQVALRRAVASLLDSADEIRRDPSAPGARRRSAPSPAPASE